MNAAVVADKKAPASGSSFNIAMQILPRPRREAMLAIYAFCRAVDDIADEPARSSEDRLAELSAWRDDLEAVYRREAPGRAGNLVDPISRFDLQLEDFLGVVEGMEMDVRETICAPSAALLDLYCDRVASAVGRLSVNVFGMDRKTGVALAHHLGRALQLTNILRDLDEDAEIGRLYLPKEALISAGLSVASPHEALQGSGLDGVCRELARVARTHFEESKRLMDQSPRSTVRAPRMMAAAYQAILDRLIIRGWAPPRRRVRTPKSVVLLAALRYGII